MNIKTYIRYLMHNGPTSGKDVPSVEIRTVEKGEMVGDNVSVILLMGATGAGKSSIQTLGERTTKWPKIVGISKAGSTAGTLELAAYRIEHRNLNTFTQKPIILVDVPGFCDKSISEMRILFQIREWMRKSRVRRVDRIIYMHPINLPRMAHSKQEGMEIFKAMCGTKAAVRTILVTTMWDQMWNDRLKSHAAHRLESLKNLYWKNFLNQGSRIEMFDKTFEAALKILRAFEPLLPVIGSELPLKGGMVIRDTDMGRKAFELLQNRYENLDGRLKDVEEAMEQAAEMRNAEYDRLLLKEKTEITDDLKNVADELQAYSPEYKALRYAVHAELDRPGSSESTTTIDTTNPSHELSSSKAHLERWLANLKEITSTRGKTQPASGIVYDPPVNLPQIYEFINSI